MRFLPLAVVGVTTAAPSTTPEAATPAAFSADPIGHLVAAKLAAHAGKPVSSPSSQTTPDIDSFVMLDNGIVSLGIDATRGGSVGYFGPSSGSYAGTNFVNIHDFGRETQVSYYTGPTPYNPPGCNQPPAYDTFPYNPIGERRRARGRGCSV
jgi:hypothetical protein